MANGLRYIIAGTSELLNLHCWQC